MRLKILSYIMILCFIVTSISLIPTKALYPQPRIDLDEYTVNVTSNTSVYVEGTVSKAYGQQISVRDTSFVPIVLGNVGNSGSKGSFRIKIPTVYIKSGSNTFYVYSEGVKGKLARSNSKTFKVNYNSGKQSQTITASNKSVQVGKSVSLGAKASSGLPLTYKSSNSSIVTVDMSGKVVGRKAGSAKITISQSGNSQYNAVSKTITITVAAAKKTQKITVSNKTVSVGKTIYLGAKSTSKGKLTYKSTNPKAAVINSKGVITGLKTGRTTIVIKQAGNSSWKPVIGKAIITVKDSYYTIVYHRGSNLGASKVTGKMSSQKVVYGSTIRLKANSYKKNGYEFIGWSTGAGCANMNKSTTIEEFSNIYMKTFQLGTIAQVRKPSAIGNGKTWAQLKESQKQKLFDKASVKNLATPGKTIHLYAVWKGKGRIAAMDWATIMANDNNFHYGKKPNSQKGGCYFCGSQHKKKGFKNAKKSYCCQPFIEAAYTHGANFSGTAGKCKRGTVFMPYDYKNSSSFKRVSYSNAKPGDVICFLGNDHIGIYVGNGAMVDASNGDNNVKFSKSWNVSISRGYHKVKWYPGPIRVYRFKY